MTRFCLIALINHEIGERSSTLGRCLICWRLLPRLLVLLFLSTLDENPAFSFPYETRDACVIEQREPPFFHDGGEKFLYPHRPISTGTISADNNPSCSLPFCAPSPRTQTDNCITYCYNSTYYNVRPPVASDAVSRRSTGTFGSFHAPLCESSFLPFARFGIIGFLSNITFHIEAVVRASRTKGTRDLPANAPCAPPRLRAFSQAEESPKVERRCLLLVATTTTFTRSIAAGFLGEQKPRERGI